MTLVTRLADVKAAVAAGGLAGDYVEFEDYALGFWRVKGMLVVPAGSNPIDMFSATV